MSDDRYWVDSGLADLIAAFDRARLRGTPQTPFAAVKADLLRLHRIVRGRRRLSVLEFGVGYSTLVLAHALAANEEEFERLRPEGLIRGPTDFRLYSVDSSGDWLESVRRGLPAEIATRTTLVHSSVRAGTFNGRLCHFYEALPDVVPDFIYIDGPDPADVVGSINGLGFARKHRVPIAADVLLMEPSLLPGAMIMVDGRTANARFLQRHLYRSFRIDHDSEADVTRFMLDEPPLGSRDAARMAYQSSDMR